jgi:AraC-like DNA-binding protein
MITTSYLLFFFSALGVFNGVMLSVWLLTRKNSQRGDFWLALLLLLLSVRIGKSVAFYFIPDLDKSILQLGLTACLLIGPCLIAYVAHLVSANSILSKVKLVFSVLIAAIVILGIVYPYSAHLDLWQYWIYRGSSYVWLVCLLWGFYLYKSQIKGWRVHWRRHVTDKGFVTLVGSSLIWFVYYTASYTSYIMGALCFSLILYLSLLSVLRTNQKQPEELKKYANNKLTESQIENYSLVLDELMEKERLYLDSQLTLPRLAKRLSIPHTLLSQLLNAQYQMNFKQYINSQRIELAQKLLLEQPNASVEDIAEQSGFVASSTFYSAFKNQTGLTPNRFRTANL